MIRVKGSGDVSRWEKLLARLYSLPNDMRFQDLQKVLLACGYEESIPRSGSSHHTFRKEGRMPITIPVHGRIKTVYVEMVRDAVDEEGKWK